MPLARAWSIAMAEDAAITRRMAMRAKADAVTTREVVIDIGDQARGAEITRALTDAGWLCAPPGDGLEHPQVLLVEWDGGSEALQQRVRAHPNAVVVLLADLDGPGMHAAARALHPSAVIPRATPPSEVVLVVSAHAHGAAGRGRRMRRR
jgi:hypothetical protein